ncbi:YjgN family protein [Dyadobacter diqingensis]|uniref:YjgN family protein n=1 Tax=Dyadobacter diqingensis TaxID=2938121 RepID=UPI0020C4A99E|nr:DUF898 family protein [Dyadobacter diqingensis]
MEINHSDSRQVSFHGEGSKLFGIYIVNLLLMIFTLGLYYPWAKAAVLRYVYQETEFEGSRFAFHGTGKEMFKGFIKAVGIFVVIYAILILAVWSRNNVILSLGMITFYAAILLLIPVAIHGALKYRMSRTSWRGIHFGYRGDLKEFVQEFVIGGLLTIATLGIYSFWFTVKLRKYIFSHLRFGNIEFAYNGDGTEYFKLNVKGYFLSLFTLGVYFFWYVKDLFAFFIDNLEMNQEGNVLKFRSTATAGGYFQLIAGNLLIIIFSLGLAAPWATVRTINFIFSNIIIDGPLDTDSIKQTEMDYSDATGEDISDMMDIGLI